MLSIGAGAQENPDALTFREIYFSALLDSHIESPSELAISPDGKDVYVSSQNSSGVFHFRRETAEGTLDPVSFVPIADATQSPIQVTDVVVTHDGRFVYASMFRGVPDRMGAVARFDRNPATGNLTLAELFPGEAQTLPGVHAPQCLVLSPDNKNLYMINAEQLAVPVGMGVLSLDANSGAMSFLQRIDHVADAQDGLNSLGMAIAPDGLNLYLTAQTGVVDYTRSNDGTIALHDFLPLEGNTSVNRVAVSPDGRSVYVTEFYNGVLYTLDRDDQGILTVQEIIDDQPGGHEVLGRLLEVVVSKDGRRVYATSSSDTSMILAFGRDMKTGSLTLLERLVDGVAGFEVLEQASTPIVSPDSKNLYIASRSALVVFQAERPDFPCRDADAIDDEYDALRKAFTLSEDIDQDGLPETASLALLKAASCGDLFDGFDEATTNAYLVNFASINADPAVYQTGILDGYQHAIASLVLTSAAMRTYLNGELDAFDTEIDPFYTFVSCVDGTCEPANTRMSPARSVGEPFSGLGDPDADGFSNAKEWANVLARGGSVREFGVSALDPSNDGSTVVTFPSENSGGTCFIATAAYGTPLAREIDSLRAFRDTRLLINPFGAAFTDLYYRLSPPAAHFIAERPAWRAASKTGIDALFLVTRSSRIFAALALFVSLFCLGFLSAGAQRLKTNT